MIRYTRKVRSILEFVDKYGFITTRICGNIFFKDSKNKDTLARRMLNKLVYNKDLISKTQSYGKELIYQRESKQIAPHKYTLINLYSIIFNTCDEVLYFKIEENWKESKKKSDAHIIFKNNCNGKIKIKAYLIEYDKYHKTDPKKYLTIYSTEEVQEWYEEKFNKKDFFPNILVINYNGKTDIKTNDSFKSIALDFDFNNLMQKIIL